MISKSIQLMSICTTVNRELQGIHIGGSPSPVTVPTTNVKLSMSQYVCRQDNFEKFWTDLDENADINIV